MRGDEELSGKLFEYDIHESKLNHIVHHIQAKKLEEQARIADFQDETDNPVALLAEASTHYDAIGLVRSRERIDQKLSNAKQRATTTETTDSTEEATETTTAGPQDGSELASQSGEASNTASQPPKRSGDHVRSQHAQANVDPNPVIDDFLTPPDHTKTGSADLMTSPEDRIDTSVESGGDMRPDDTPDSER